MRWGLGRGGGGWWMKEHWKKEGRKKCLQLTYFAAELLLVTETFTEKSSPMRTLSSKVISNPSTLLDSD